MAAKPLAEIKIGEYTATASFKVSAWKITLLFWDPQDEHGKRHTNLPLRIPCQTPVVVQMENEKHESVFAMDLRSTDQLPSIFFLAQNGPTNAKDMQTCLRTAGMYREDQ